MNPLLNEEYFKIFKAMLALAAYIPMSVEERCWIEVLNHVSRVEHPDRLSSLTKWYTRI